ncbi:hypothetical protein TGAM01_v206693 [Trichoderma gamsii]|uniref:Uncharacterized protein n=1 Tax=Trichoderma gamsii TaxID=398673 RepID=A0A2P4ZJ81_9HYPO|nr:hypothetical protein TGAM01_v206693 [Trichoderma gamsii]PON24361.1 hypothetical protein TGAM01_v206693 [Trichoderma gamsii]
MVSFFGLRFGGDKKKSQSKQSDKKQVAQQSNQRYGKNSPNDSFKFPPPQQTSSRSGSSTSTARNLGWRATLKGVPAALSMVDLTSPRKPSMGSLRHGLDGGGFKPWMKPNASMTNLAVPNPFGVDKVPPLPAGSRQSALIDPLDTRFNKKSGSTTNSTSHSGGGSLQRSGSKSPLSQSDLKAEPEPMPEPEPEPEATKKDSENLAGLEEFDDFGEPGPDVGIRGSGYAGYPSPPQSVETEEQWPPMSPVDGEVGAEADAERNREADRKGSTNQTQQQFIVPGFANGPGPAMLPSPSSSTSRKSEDTRGSPVVQNVHAKRDTLTFNSSRRRSFTMVVEEEELEKHRQQQQHRVEGLAGNFSDFDFGDGVVNQQTVAVGTLGIELVQSPVEMERPHPFKEAENVEDVASAMSKENGARTEDEGAVGEILGEQYQQSELSDTAYLASPVASPIESPVDTFMMSPFASPMAPQKQFRAFSPFSPQRLQVAIPDDASPSAPAQQPLPSPSAVSAGVESPRPNRRPSQMTMETPNTLASVLNSFGSDPPQGFNSRMTTESRARGPPQPLQQAAFPSLAARMETPSQSPRSPYGPAADESNYMRAQEAPRPPMDRVPMSPFAARTPMEGEFPVMKGLPRGRQPPRPQVPFEDSPDRRTEERSPRPFSKWGGFGFDRPDTRNSPLPKPPRTPKGQPPASPSWSISTPTSDIAPRLPSPTFPSLEKAISATSEDLAKSFEMSFDAPQPSPLANEFSIHDVAIPSAKSSPVIRVEAKKAPPRPTPSPINLPPLMREKGPLTPSPLYSPSGSTFI